MNYTAMVESFIPELIESGSNTNSLSEASAEDLVRVSESMQKAQQMGAMIRDDQKKNTHIAQFLTYLFGTVQDDEIRIMVVELFSKPDQNNIGMSLAIEEMVAIFLPFYASKADELTLQNSFPNLHYQISLAEESYLGYTKMLYREYPLFETLDKDTLSSLITALLVYHGIVAEQEGVTLQDIANRIRASL